MRSEQETRLWSVQETADYFGVPIKTIYTWSYTGKGPPGYRVGKYLRFKPSECAAWLDGQGDPRPAA